MNFIESIFTKFVTSLEKVICVIFGKYNSNPSDADLGLKNGRRR
jgi:hypothetical protein